MEIILILVIVGLIIYHIYTKKKYTEKPIDYDIKLPDNSAFINPGPEVLPYHKKYLLTKNEYYFYKKLKPIADELGYTILTKIRMADLVEVNSNQNRNDWTKYFGKIKAKHIDFALAKPDNLQVELLIELDDSSHAQNTRVQRDNFVNAVYSKCGYKILHVFAGEPELRLKIMFMIQKST